MKNEICLFLFIFNAPIITQAGVIPDGKKIEFIGIISFISLAILSLVIYYFKWKADKEKEASGKAKYKINQYS